MTTTTEIAGTKWTRHAPGSYEMESPDGTVEVFRSCDCGHCNGWSVKATDENGYESGRWEGFRTRNEAAEFVTDTVIPQQEGTAY